MEIQKSGRSCDRRCVFGVLVVAVVVYLAIISQYEEFTVPAFASRMRLFFQEDAGNATHGRPLHGATDVHYSDEFLGHTGSGPVGSFLPAVRPNTIAIGGGITSAKIKASASKQEILAKCPLFSAMLPSFCATCGTKYEFHFYFAYDYTDPLFSNPRQLAVFSEVFHEQIAAKCPRQSRIQLHMVQCHHAKKPAWAQNDAMMEAYLDNMQYFYRINDDSRLQNKRWPSIFVERLAQYDPPNLGVVGPKHQGGNTRILTYDFTHHTHIDMFGFHYPRDFPDWYADDWITKVYQPGRVQKMEHVALIHTMQLGQRYKHHFKGQQLKTRFESDKPLIQRYARFLSSRDHVTRDPSRVIALSLHDALPSMTFGALRNVQQAPVYFPGWTVRVYVLSPNLTRTPVPARLLNKMATLGAEIHTVETRRFPNESLAYAALEDTSVHTVLFRHPEFRLSDRQKAAVDEWVRAPALLHCMKDHPSHASLPLIHGLLGIKIAPLRNTTMAQTLTGLLKDLSKTQSQESFGKTLWQEFHKLFLCHDSMACRGKFVNCKPFPVALQNTAYFEGQRYDAHMDIKTSNQSDRYGL